MVLQVNVAPKKELTFHPNLLESNHSSDNWNAVHHFSKFLQSQELQSFPAHAHSSVYVTVTEHLFITLIELFASVALGEMEFKFELTSLNTTEYNSWKKWWAANWTKNNIACKRLPKGSRLALKYSVKGAIPLLSEKLPKGEKESEKQEQNPNLKETKTSLTWAKIDEGGLPNAVEIN